MGTRTIRRWHIWLWYFKKLHLPTTWSNTCGSLSWRGGEDSGQSTFTHVPSSGEHRTLSPPVDCWKPARFTFRILPMGIMSSVRTTLGIVGLKITLFFFSILQIKLHQEDPLVAAIFPWAAPSFERIISQYKNTYGNIRSVYVFVF